MEHLHILNTREKSKVLEKLKEQFGFKEEFDYTLLKSNKDKYYIIHRDISQVKFEEYNIDSVGMYFCSEDSGGNLRPSIEGSQMIGPHCDKNIKEISDGEFKLWIAGHDLEADEEWSPFLLIKHDDDFIGCGKVIDGKLKNYVPKSRRITNPI